MRACCFLLCIYVYSRSPADPSSDGVLLPPLTGIEVSTAIISARMSSTGYNILAEPSTATT
jgi:hypothetical protein